MGTLTSDRHIHSRNSCDGACMAVADLVREAARKGIGDYGPTDHIHTPFNPPDLERSRRESELTTEDKWDASVSQAAPSRSGPSAPCMPRAVVATGSGVRFAAPDRPRGQSSRRYCTAAFTSAMAFSPHSRSMA